MELSTNYTPEARNCLPNRRHRYSMPAHRSTPASGKHLMRSGIAIRPGAAHPEPERRSGSPVRLGRPLGLGTRPKVSG